MKHSLNIRDYLAIERTRLSNERTLFSGIRTALAIFITGATIIKLFEMTQIEIIGWFFVASSFVFTLYVFYRYKKNEQLSIRAFKKKSITQLEKESIFLED